MFIGGCLKTNRRRGFFKVLLVALIFATWAFISVGSASAAEWHVYPGQSIQTAINNAGVDDTIYVHSGTYNEHVNVSKRLALIGVGKPITDAGGNGSAITLSADGIVLDGFTVINSSGSYQQGGILVYSSNNTVINNTASNNSHGIILNDTNTNTLSGNTANLNTDDGIALFSSSHNTLTGNTVDANYDGGIYLDSSSNNTLTDNTVDANYDVGIYLRYSNNNTLTGNTATANNDFGIWLSSSSNNTLTGNSALNNSENGIRLTSSSNNTLTGNNASNNTKGIDFYASSNNTLTDNIFSNNSYGIYMQYSSNNTINNNYFNNPNNAWDAGNNIWNITQISGTNIIGGSWLGGNYWSDYMGEDTNGDGIGDIPVPYNSSGNIVNGGDRLPLVKVEPSFFDTGEGTYPSISGTFTGTITPSQNLTVSTLYTYSCTGTGGHTKSFNLYENDTLRASGVWSGYQGDWHNVTFTEVTLLKGHEYRYVIETVSYPQIVHAESKNVTGGRITYEDFVDINGKRHDNWMPAIRLSCAVKPRSGTK